MSQGTPSPDLLYEGLGNRIREARERLKFSQEALAGAVGLNRTSITNIEKGRQRLLLHTFFDIANALNLKPENLLPDMPEPGRLRIPARIPNEIKVWMEGVLQETEESVAR